MPGSWMAELEELPGEYYDLDHEDTLRGPLRWKSLDNGKGTMLVCDACGPVFTSLWDNDWTSDDYPAIKAHGAMPEHQALVALSPDIRM